MGKPLAPTPALCTSSLPEIRQWPEWSHASRPGSTGPGRSLEMLHGRTPMPAHISWSKSPRAVLTLGEGGAAAGRWSVWPGSDAVDRGNVHGVLVLYVMTKVKLDDCCLRRAKDGRLSHQI
jgi:hypothetical protein